MEQLQIYSQTAAREDPRDRRDHRRGHELRDDAAGAAHHDRPPAGRRPRRAPRRRVVQPADHGGRRGGVALPGRRRALHRADAPRRAVPDGSLDHGRPVRPGERRADGARERRGDAHHGAGADLHRALQPHAPVLRQRQRRPRADHARPGPGRGPRQGGRAGPQGRLPGHLRRQRPDPGRGAGRLHARRVPRRGVHLHGAGLAVQLVHPPAHDHDGAAAQPAGGAADADGLRHDRQRLQRDRADDAVRDREEELDPAGRLHEHPARGRRREAHRAHPGEPRASAAHPDDDHRDCRRHAAHRLRPRRRVGVAGVDGGHDHRRPDAVPAAHAAGDAGRLLVLRRHARAGGRATCSRCCVRRRRPRAPRHTRLRRRDDAGQD